MDKTIRIGLYRILRKLGVKREQIIPDALLKGKFFFDNQDWNCFLFFLETNFNITISAEDELKLETVGSTINTIHSKLMKNFSSNQVLEACY